MKIRREVKIGLFALLVLFAMYWGINFLKGQDLFSTNNTYYATYDQVNGLQKSSAVMIKGYKVGVVSDIKYDPEKFDKIIVEFTMNRKYKVPENSRARIFSDGLLGGKAIEIVYGDSPNVLKSGDTLRSESDKDILEVAGSEIEQLKQMLGSLFADISVTLGNINTILTDNAAYLNSSLANITDITGNLSHIVRTEREDIIDIVGSISQIAKTLNENASKVDNIITNVEVFSDSLASVNLNNLTSNLNSAIDQFGSLMDKINSGEGNVGKFVHDEELYKSLSETAANLAELLEDVKENPGRYVNISVFGGRSKKR